MIRRLIASVAIGPVFIISTAGCKDDGSKMTCLSPDDPACLQAAEKQYVNSLQERIASSVNEVTEYQVSVRSWLSEEDFNQKIVADPRIRSVKQVTLYFPKLYHGLRVTEKTPETLSKSQILSWIIATAAQRSQAAQIAWQNDILNSMIVERDSAQLFVGSMRIIATPEEIHNWWNENNTYIRFVQTIDNDIDRIQRTWEPEEPL